MDFGFSYEIERELFDKIPAVREIESRVTKELSEHVIGDGVKSVTIGLIAVGPDKAKRFPIRKPRYKAGSYVVQELGVHQQFQDTLEFDIKASVEEVRAAGDTARLAEVIRRALGFVYPTLLTLKIPDFDVTRFVAILDDSLSNISTTPSVSVKK